MDKPVTLNDIPLISWPHRLVDNFFSEKDLSWIKKTMEKGYEQIKRDYSYCFENDKMLGGQDINRVSKELGHSTENQFTHGFSCFVPFWSTERVADIIDDVWQENIKIYNHKRNNNFKRKDYFTFLELNIYPPKMYYSWHMDTSYKSFTAVVYIGNEGTGTTLKSAGNEVTLTWKDNRSILFMNADLKTRNERDFKNKYSTFHRYGNPTDEVRYAVNFNMTHIDSVADVLKLLQSKDSDILNYRNVVKRNRTKFQPIIVNAYT
tara:strand:- start:46 stop:834 length:789 start_codon:yes stop_codon:yes gene_type:complete